MLTLGIPTTAGTLVALNGTTISEENCCPCGQHVICGKAICRVYRLNEAFGRLPFFAKVLKRCIYFNNAGFEITQQELKTLLLFMWQEGGQPPQSHQKQMLA